MAKTRTKDGCVGVLYARPNNGVTDIFRDREMTRFYARDPWMQYRKTMARIFNGAWFWVEIIK